RAGPESGPLSAERMVELGLASNTGWPESAKESIRSRAGDDAEFMDISAYISHSAKFSSPVIAIVGGEGAINTGSASGGPFGTNGGSMSDTLSAAILEAARNERVEAIVFRVDSPGGSPTASDQIWNAIELAKTEYDKPVVVSMGSVAASGGYYVATGADWIVANRSTITGSIGIFGGKMAFSEGLARLGVNVRSINVGGPFTGAFTSADTFTDDQRVLLRAWLKRGYDRFLSLVAEGRDMTIEDVHERARGRVWSGKDALEQGLVDELGGLLSAIHKARAMAGIEPDSDVRYMMYPLTDGGFPFGGSFASAASDNLETLSDISHALNDPRVKALLSEFEATRSGNIQARLPAMTER
ncbi:MAG: signal peptide peptidase SppA, partial [Henriciella sp.]|nr:signal peptide peptidase SppA [Henriciella sp.]